MTWKRDKSLYSVKNSEVQNFPGGKSHYFAQDERQVEYALTTAFNRVSEPPNSQSNKY